MAHAQWLPLHLRVVHRLESNLPNIMPSRKKTARTTTVVKQDDNAPPPPLRIWVKRKTRNGKGSVKRDMYTDLQFMMDE